jgi:23S rRNA pseudouridine1911/1915/1917 synthase
VVLCDASVRPELLPERIPLAILYEDERLLLIDKPAGLPVAPGAGHPAGTLANALRGLGCPLSAVEGPLRPGIVHRLDRGTSGVMVVAKTDATHRLLAHAFRAHAIVRQYLALALGQPSWDETQVDAPLGRRRQGRKAHAIRDDGSAARTRFRVLERRRDLALISACPETGRTHQIRVHLASLGHVVVGDTLYGGGSPAARFAASLGLRRLGLHAARLGSPDLGFDVEAPLPADLVEALRKAAPA